MSLIVAARFDAWEQAGAAARVLSERGYTDDALHTFYVNSAGAHDRHPVGGDRTADPDASGEGSGKKGALGGATLLAAAGAGLSVVVVALFAAPVWVMIAAGAVGAYVGSLLGAVFAAGQRKRTQARHHVATAAKTSGLSPDGIHQPRTVAADENAGFTPVRHAGVLLAVQTLPDQEAFVAKVLRDAGGLDVERAQGKWANGSWADFDPVAAPELSDKVQQSV